MQMKGFWTQVYGWVPKRLQPCSLCLWAYITISTVRSCWVLRSRGPSVVISHWMVVKRLLCGVCQAIITNSLTPSLCWCLKTHTGVKRWHPLNTLVWKLKTYCKCEEKGSQFNVRMLLATLMHLWMCEHTHAHTHTNTHRHTHTHTHTHTFVLKCLQFCEIQPTMCFRLF